MHLKKTNIYSLSQYLYFDLSELFTTALLFQTIKLPEEPDEVNPDCITVSLRTSLGLKQRRFHKENTIQVIRKS